MGLKWPKYLSRMALPVPSRAHFRAPTDLVRTPLRVNRILVVGSCVSEVMAFTAPKIFAGASVDHILYNTAGELPEQPPRPIAEYDFQVIVLPLRTAMPEGMFFNLSYDNTGGYEEALAHSEQRVLQLLQGALAYHAQHGITTFVANFQCPQQNSMGLLLRQNDPRNPVWFVRRLNDTIAEFVDQRSNIYLLNLDEIASNMGRRYVQDDVMAVNSHGSMLTDTGYKLDRKRLHPPRPASDCYEMRTDEYNLDIWSEVALMHRIIRQQDNVKIVICDLDDTLWRGVVAEEGGDNTDLTEGWPLGIIEALCTLKHRGVLLAIVSKNDEGTIRRFWETFLGGGFPLSNFASIRINWEPKEQNVADVLRETNLLARNAVFIDDNPVERERVQRTFPEIRTLGADLYHIRRVLLWSAETQVAQITEESGRRTEMIQQGTMREHARDALPREEFLASLNVEMTPIEIHDAAHPRFARAFELLNKTNQFNTTGRRWTQDEIHRLFAASGRLEAFEVKDRFTNYGLVAVAIVSGNTIEQFAMSCRIIGLDAELAIVARMGQAILSKNDAVRAVIRETDANFLCRELYSKTGFEHIDGVWIAAASSLKASPPHVKIAASKEAGLLERLGF